MQLDLSSALLNAMKVIICGAGQVGFGIAERLSAEGAEVSIVDASADLVQRANDVLEVKAFQGNAAHPDVLERAGAHEADLLIAVTLHDEVNMVACQVANALFDIPTKIARVRSQSYFDPRWARLFERENMAIDQVISPEIEVGRMILRRLETPGAFETIPFADRRVVMLGISCGPDCPIIDTQLLQLQDLFPDLNAAIVAIARGGRLMVAHRDDQVQVGDDVYLIADASQIGRALHIFGHEETQARRLIIAGGGNIGFYVARELEKRKSDIRIKVIEVSRVRAMEIGEVFERAVVMHGSALSEDVLREAGIATADTLIAVTNDDQTNLLTAALAKQLGCKSSLCLLNSANYAPMIRSLGIDAELNPKAVTVSSILQHMRRGRIRGVHTLHNGAGEILEAEVLETSAVVGKTIKELDLSEGVRFGAILRGGRLVRPTGATELEIRDRVVLFARADFVSKIEHLFRVSPDYF